MSSTSVFMAAFVLCLAISVVGVGAGSLAEDKGALLDFLAAATSHGRGLNWRPTTAVCGNWTGVTCAADGSRVIAVHLKGLGFGGGPIPPNTLSRLSALEVLSLSSSGLTGTFPADFTNLTDLTALDLQLNNFSGPLPSDFSPWKSLTALDLSCNGFSGSIPEAVSHLSELTALNLSDNRFSGQIPDVELPNLILLDLSNNHLSGKIPSSLRRFPNSSFSGNDLSSTDPFTSQIRPLSSPVVATRKMSESTILGIIVGGSVLVFLMLALFIYLCCSVKKEDNFVPGKGRLRSDRSSDKAVIGDPDTNNRLVFFEGCTFAFDLEDLLRASAEVLGKGTFGTTYKAVLEDSTTVVVKRLKDGVGKKEFEQQMEVVGRIKHENVVELRAYYYSKEEKLIVYDYYSQGSVFSLIHGKRGQQRTPLDWETRLKIAHGAARGIAHIHAENNGKLVHGNIKSSNIFLNSQGCGCVADFGLPSLINPLVPPVSRTAGYRAPEVLDTRKASQASDVYSFGVLMMELLTGKSSIHVRRGGEEVVHLVRWVQSVVREEWTAEVFDAGLIRRLPEVEDEMVEMLRIAMNCVVRTPELRPKMAEVVRMVEEVRRLDGGNRSSTEAAASETSTPTPVLGADQAQSL